MSNIIIAKTMSDAVVDDSTPGRKRKRASEKTANLGSNAFVNAAFTNSTPKRISGKRRLISAKTNAYENKISYVNNPCMEIKSIAELVQRGQLEENNTTSFNPYEVQRKPPKKKKREAAIEEACFENPALNLNVPEKKFNPYEVKREIGQPQGELIKGFVNKALNIKSKDSEFFLRNPFEVKRCNDKENNLNGNIKTTGIENYALDDAANTPSNLKIGLPFTPTVGCRIDFNNISLSQLTPNKLLFAEKLVFSPVLRPSIIPKRSLDSISEESSSVSIGKELDRYQLELENSINEAKNRKNGNGNIVHERIEEEQVYQFQLKIEKRVSLTPKLADIEETDESENEKQAKEIISSSTHEPELKTLCQEKSDEIEHARIELESNFDSKGDIVFDSDEELNEIDFKVPAPFVRAYRRDVESKQESKESLNSQKANKSSSECIPEYKNSKSIKSFLRKSMRKIIPHNLDHDNKESEPESNHIKEDSGQWSHILSNVRNSLRRKTKTKRERVEENGNEIPLPEISIIDSTERKIKLKSSGPQNEYMRIEDLTNERKHFVRHGSLRRSTKDIRQKLMNKLFQHKQEDYTFEK